MTQAMQRKNMRIAPEIHNPQDMDFKTESSIKCILSPSDQHIIDLPVEQVQKGNRSQVSTSQARFRKPSINIPDSLFKETDFGRKTTDMISSLSVNTHTSYQKIKDIDNEASFVPKTSTSISNSKIVGKIMFPRTTKSKIGK